MSTVDVVVPCYNYGHYLPACVDSVLSQPGVRARVLIIDDASSDDSAQVGRQLASSDSRVEFRRHAVNKGHIATYNEGLLDWSTAEYTVLLSADDMLTPNALSRSVRIMDADTNIGMVYGRPIHFEHEITLPKTSPRDCTYEMFPGEEWLEGRCRTGQNAISSPEVVVRGSVQRTVGGYRPELPHSGDLEMWMRIAAVSSVAYVRRVPQAFYRVHPASMVRTKYKSSFVDLQHRKAAFDFFFQYHAALSNGDRLYDLAKRALAREALWDACRAYDRDEVKEARASELEEFAITTYAAATSLPEYGALRRRQALGPAVCNRTQLFATSALVRRGHRWLARRRWKRRGV